jgi:hypothetical protein
MFFQKKDAISVLQLFNICPQRNAMKFHFLEKSPLYLFLIALYPVLFLLSVNISQVGPLAGVRPGVVFLLFGGLIYVFALLFTRNTQRAAFNALIILLFFFLIFFVLYTPTYNALRNIATIGHTLVRHRYMVPATFLLLVLITYLVIRFGKRVPQKALNSISLFANLIAIVLTVIPVITIISVSISNNQESTQVSSKLPSVDTLNVTANANRPDIYYIILDMHTNDNVLNRLLDYDDSAFTHALQQRGFFVSQCSQSNYPNTHLSLTSSLNMDYIQNLGLGITVDDLYPAMQQSRVQRMLQSAGYSTYTFETGYYFTEIKNSGHYSSPSSGTQIITYPGLTSFESLILSVSAGQVLSESRSELSAQVNAILDAPYTQRRTDVLNVLDTLPELPTQNGGPKFVFAHMIAPHDPFVFQANGDPVNRRTAFTDVRDLEYDYQLDSYKVPYVQEVIYLHKRVLEMVDKIISESKTPPIIILQGDHGLPLTVNQNAEFQILNAYYFPGVKDTGLYNTISPVNSFRLLFNDYFGANYPLLADQSYLTNETLTLDPVPYSCP